MSGDAFLANVSPGGLTGKDDIKILVCYLLLCIDTGLTKDDIVTVIIDNQIANYFEITNAISSLLADGNIVFDQESLVYKVSGSGKMIAEQLKSSLPYTIREKAVSAAINLLAKKKCEKENVVKITRLPNGCSVNCVIPGGNDMDLMNVSIYVPDMLQAKAVKRNFHKNPDLIYQALLSCFTGNYELLKESLQRIMDIKFKNK